MIEQHLLEDTGVLVLTMSHPPVNAMAMPIRRGLFDALLAADTDEAVRGVVITGAGKLFCGGADLGEFVAGTAMDEPCMHEHILPLVADMSKPVVAAINGAALGGGFELALGLHGRVALASASIALPEVTLGLMPGAGGTQLLPRAIGLEAATAMIVSGGSRRAAELGEGPLLARVVEGDLLEQAAAHALELAERAAAGEPLPLLRRLKVEHPEPEGFLAFARGQARARRDYTLGMDKALDAISLSLRLPAEEGIRREHELFKGLLASEQHAAIRHGFLAERAAPKVDDLPAGTQPRRVASAAVVGAGFMGSGIAVSLARAGIPVKLHDSREGAAERAIAGMGRDLGDKQALVTPAGALEDLADADLVIEAVVESMEVKREVFGALDRVTRPQAILASNTSTLDLDAIAAETADPSRVFGLHFFGPAQVMRLLEIVRGERTAADVLATGLALARRIGKVPVVARVCPGFIGNRMFDKYMAQALALVAEGLRPQDVDKALETFGMRMGPFRTMDLVGNDVLAAARVGLPSTPGTRLGDRLAELGRLGQKSGSGWYRYPHGPRQPLPDPELEALLPEAPARKPAPEAIVKRCLLALVNEGVRILEEGIAQRGSDIDVAFLLGYGFPAEKGGPMYYADSMSLPLVERALRRLAAETGDAFWEPAELLVRYAREGRKFSRAGE